MGRATTTRLTLLTLLAATIPLVGCVREDAPTLVLRGATIIDGTDTAPVASGELVVASGRVACVGQQGACEVPRGADEVEGAGFWVIPGLIDVGTRPRWEVEPDRTERLERLRFLLGVTTAGATDRGADAPGNARVALSTDYPRRPVARLVVGSAHGDGSIVGLPELAGLAADTAAIDAAARELAASGAHLEPGLAGLERGVAPYGLPPGLHRLAEVPLVFDAIRSAGRTGGTDPADSARAAASLAGARRFVRVFHEAGGRIAAGSNDVLPPGLGLHEEMKALVRAGLTPSDAISAATGEAAAAIGVRDSLGTLEPGHVADFVVLEGDPLADIGNIELVSRVAKGGVLHDPASILGTLGDDLGDRTTPPALRLVAGLLALLVTLLATAIAIRRHARRQPRGRPPLRVI